MENLAIDNLIHYTESPTIIKGIYQPGLNHSLTFGGTCSAKGQRVTPKNAFKKERDEYMQSSIKKDVASKEWLLKDKKLNAFSSKVIKEVESLFRSTASIEAYSIELVKEDLPGLPEDLTMYIKLSNKVSKEEMMDLWGRISKKHVETIRNLANNQDEFEEMLDKTTITLQRY